MSENETTAPQCVSNHWALQTRCVLPGSHRANWHEALHPLSGNRMRWRQTMGVYVTEELSDGEWRELGIVRPDADIPEAWLDAARDVMANGPRGGLVPAVIRAVRPLIERAHDADATALTAPLVEVLADPGAVPLWDDITPAQVIELACGEIRRYATAPASGDIEALARELRDIIAEPGLDSFHAWAAELLRRRALTASAIDAAALAELVWSAASASLTGLAWTDLPEPLRSDLAERVRARLAEVARKKES